MDCQKGINNKKIIIMYIGTESFQRLTSYSYLGRLRGCYNHALHEV